MEYLELRPAFHYECIPVLQVWKRCHCLWYYIYSCLFFMWRENSYMAERLQRQYDCKRIVQCKFYILFRRDLAGGTLRMWFVFLLSLCCNANLRYVCLPSALYSFKHFWPFNGKSTNVGKPASRLRSIKLIKPAAYQHYWHNNLSRSILTSLYYYVAPTP